MAHLLVIGGASYDILHLRDRTVTSAGGAGMYTAMAARRSGVRVSMFGPRPEPVPEYLHPIAGFLEQWLGPGIPPKKLPHFEIFYQGGKTEYHEKDIQAEADLPISLLPPDLSTYDLVHVTPLGDANTQLSFIDACRQQGAKRISVGTGLFNVEEQPDLVRAAYDKCDFGFLNSQEAKAIYGSLDSARTTPGKVLFITMGGAGALIIQGEFVTQLPAVPCEVLDPTGAGDTFCGATVAHIMLGDHPVMAARLGTALASEMIQHIGPQALMREDPPPDFPLDGRAEVNVHQVQKVAELVAALPEVTAYDFTGPGLPPIGHPLALDWFFAGTLQQFGFWTTMDGKYHQPLIASMDGQTYKGSDYLWQGFMRPFETDPDFYTVERQANLTEADMLGLFRADDGSDPMPALDLHLQQARQYGLDMLALDMTPRELLGKVQNSARPLKTFLEMLDHVGGYKEDPLRKKSGLLAFILNQRPEKFLSFAGGEEVNPVIDYHAMRACLRIGLVEVVDEELIGKLAARIVLVPSEEHAVRYAAYQAIHQVAALSGKSMGAVDWFFFNSRTRCPEMTEPDCPRCQVDPVCAHYKELFQPVLRTTNY